MVEIKGSSSRTLKVAGDCVLHAVRKCWFWLKVPWEGFRSVLSVAIPSSVSPGEKRLVLVQLNIRSLAQEVLNACVYYS